MKKLIATACLLLAFSPVLASAQTIDAATQAQIEAIVERIVELKIQIILIQIQELREQLAILIAQGQGQESEPSTPTYTPPAPLPVLPSPSVELVASCSTEGPILDVETANLSYNQIQLQLTGFDVGGEYHSQKNLVRPSATRIDWMPAGSYHYNLTAYSGYTAPFSEGTAQDTRAVEYTTSGDVTLSSCN